MREQERLEEHDYREWLRRQERSAAEWEKEQEKARKQQEADAIKKAEEERWAPRPFKPQMTKLDTAVIGSSPNKEWGRQIYSSA